MLAGVREGMKLDLEDAKRLIFGTDEGTQYSSFISRKDMVGNGGFEEGPAGSLKREDIDYSAFGQTRRV